MRRSKGRDFTRLECIKNYESILNINCKHHVFKQRFSAYPPPSPRYMMHGESYMMCQIIYVEFFGFNGFKIHWVKNVGSKMISVCISSVVLYNSNVQTDFTEISVYRHILIILSRDHFLISSISKFGLAAIRKRITLSSYVASNNPI